MPNKRHHSDRFSTASRLQTGACAGRYANKFDPVVDSIYGFALTSGQLERPNQNG